MRLPVTSGPRRPCLDPAGLRRGLLVWLVWLLRVAAGRLAPQRSWRSRGNARGACAVLTAVAWLWPAGVRAQSTEGRGPPAPAETVTLLPRTPPLEAPPQTPTLAPPPDLSAVAGRPVTRVVVAIDGTLWTDEAVAAPSNLRPGDPFTADGARRAMNALLDSGHFARASVEARPDGAGTRVTLHVVPRKLIDRVRVDFRGADVEREEALHEVDLAQDSEIVGDDVDRAKRRIEHYFALHGYPVARADISTRPTDDPNRVLVFVDVAPGPARIIDDRRFYVLGASVEDVASAEGTYAIGAGARADEIALDRADTALEQTLRSRGWAHADVSHDLARIDREGHGTRIELRVRIDTGARLVARFDGNEHYDADVLGAVLALDTETDRSTSHLADKIRAFYQKRGFLDIEVRPEVRTGEPQGAAPPQHAAVQLIVFHVTEGQRVRVSGRQYPCLKLDAVKNLHAGGPRSPHDIGNEIDSFLDDELPGADFLVSPDPRSLSRLIGGGAGQVQTGPRPVPIDLSPKDTFVSDTYDRAAAHVQELYRNEGFLHAEVGPVQVVRARCDPRSPPGRCVRMPMPPVPTDLCAYDPAGLPARIDPLGSAFTCRADSARGVACAPDLQLVIPVRLGPRARTWDVAFTGVKSAREPEVAEAADLTLGDAASTTKVEDARRRIVDWYKERGYYYVDVKATLESSSDNTRARVRFDVTEGDQVIVRSILINGLQRTNEGVVRRRVAIEVGQPFRTSDVRKTQQQIDTLGVFSTSSIGISDPYVPQAAKDVIIDVVERDSQYVEIRPGFSTGEGVRGVLEYGHRNLLGDAWALTLHLEASYLPDFLILDQGVAQNYAKLDTAQRIATRDTITLSWPEIGLGPTFRAQLDGVYVNDLERDFTLQKGAVAGTVFWRPVRQFQIGVGPEYENNFVHIFNGQDIATFLQEPQNQGNTDLAALLRVPDGRSNVVAGQITLTWDRRDNAVNPHRGTYFAAGIEQVNSYPVASGESTNGTASTAPAQFFSHFFRLTQTIRGYVPITPGVTFASEIRLGEVITTSCAVLGGGPAPPTCTYEDRLFFMGGYDSMRGWLQDSFIPSDYVDAIAANQVQCTNNQNNCPGVIVRGGNLMINPRFELRFPIFSPVEGAVFSDLGYLWSDPRHIEQYSFLHNIAPRADVGAGVRIDTPVGPIVFDYGINVTRRSYEDFGAFHFAIGLF